MEVKDCIFSTSEYSASSLAYKNYLLNEKIKGVEPRLNPHLKSSAFLNISQEIRVIHHGRVLNNSDGRFPFYNLAE